MSHEHPRFDSPSPEQKEGIPVNFIPEELTGNGKVLFFNKIKDDKKTGDGLLGAIKSERVEVGKRIQLMLGTSTEVVRIMHHGTTYTIETKSGSIYLFDPSTSMEKPDYLKK